MGKDIPHHLIIIPGHILLNDQAEAERDFEYYQNEKHWYLETYQRDELNCYLEHVHAGVMILKNDPKALLIFSGGRTRSGNKKWSEAESYLAVARSLKALDKNFEKRVLTEDYARDSLQNILFSYLLYYKKFARFPKKITVFGLKFKEERFDWHRKTIGIPKDNFEYIGLNNPPAEKMDMIRRFESEYLAHYKIDPYGLSNEFMTRKKERDPHHDGNPYLDLLEKLPGEIDVEKLKKSLI